MAARALLSALLVVGLVGGLHGQIDPDAEVFEVAAGDTVVINPTAAEAPAINVDTSNVIHNNLPSPAVPTTPVLYEQQQQPAVSQPQVVDPSVVYPSVPSTGIVYPATPSTGTVYPATGTTVYPAPSTGTVYPATGTTVYPAPATGTVYPATGTTVYPAPSTGTVYPTTGTTGGISAGTTGGVGLRFVTLGSLLGLGGGMGGGMAMRPLGSVLFGR